MTLREQIMERLFSVASVCRRGPVEPALHDPLWTGNREVYGALADECIRQMQWARLGGGTEPYGPCLASHEHNHTGCQWDSCPPMSQPPYALTAAPEGWKP